MLWGGGGGWGEFSSNTAYLIFFVYRECLCTFLSLYTEKNDFMVVTTPNSIQEDLGSNKPKIFLGSGGQGGDTDRGNGKQKGLLMGQRTKNHFPKRGKHKPKELTPNQPNTPLLRTTTTALRR